MFDYSFFAMLFLIATSLSPADSGEVTLVNARHPDQAIVFTRGQDGRFAMTLNGRDVGHFIREGDAVLHHTGEPAPTRFAIAELARGEDLRANARRVRLAGRFAATTLAVSREGGRVELSDPAGELLVTRLILRHARR